MTEVTNARGLDGCAPLDQHANPFSSNSNALLFSAAETALEEVIGLIGLRRRAIVIIGRAGSGKTFLLKTASRFCSDMGLSVRHFDRGALADPATDGRFDVVLVDGADSLPDAVLLALLFPDPSHRATTWVFACLPSSADRFRCLDANIVEIRELSADDAQTCLLEQASSIGRPDLFAPDALDLIVHQARGSPRLLFSTASLAFFTAAWGGATQIGVRHVAYWLTSQIPSDVAEAGAPPLAGAYRRESTQIALRPKPFPVARPRRLNRRTTAIAASIGLAAAVAAFWVAGNDEVVGPRMTVPVSPNQAVAELSVVQTPAPTVSPGISTARDVADPASVNAPVGNATGAAADRAIKPAEQPRAAKTTRATRSATIARSARAPKRTGSQTAANKGAQQTRESAHLAKRSDDLARQVTEAALQARHAARVATEAAHRADQAAHRANLAALQAERAARQASWGLRVQLPWKGLRAPRSAS